MEATMVGVDGRTARAQRTREATVDALIALLGEGNVQPSVEEIAARAGVSVRSIFGHFGDRESLFAAVSERRREKLVAEWGTLPPPDAPLSERIAALAAHRARIYEDIAPTRRGALLMEPFSEGTAAGLAAFRALKRREVTKLFREELRADDELAGAVTALTSFSAWEELRTHQGLSPRRAEAALRRGLERLLGSAQS